jgi:deoxyribodipyrimidine photolyase-related protein
MIQSVNLILGDQLNLNHSWFDEVRSDRLFVLMEIKPESTYVTHHIQKIAGIFAGMRAFAKKIEKNGHQVKYIQINDSENKHSFEQNLQLIIKQSGASQFYYQEPDEYRLDQLFQEFCKKLSIDTSCCSTEHFITDRSAVKDFYNSRKRLVMEYFYRELRKKYEILMDEDGPVSGKWNYDQKNRKKLPKNHRVPEPFTFNNDVTRVYQDILKADLPHIGKIEANQFLWPINRDQAIQLLEAFAKHFLHSFGKYQDALSERYWSIYHSRLSFCLNTKMLHPLEVIRRIEKEWDEQDIEQLAQIEGFIRQILGWREYMRGIYWMKMPEYGRMNYFEAERSLPSFYWTGETKMACLKKAINQSLEYAYAHHIQRLMITGNFAVLAGINPSEVDEWYLGIYIDAFEWVEMPNTRGMSQFADGGIVATKPYVSSASYIHKMGDHCKNCYYKYKTKIGDNACPFNSLYWHFIDRHRNRLSTNPRMGMMYRVWDKYSEDSKSEILDQAEMYLRKLNTL